MEKEIYEKLNQLDRIEYSVKVSGTFIPNFFAAISLLSLCVITGTIIGVAMIGTIIGEIIKGIFFTLGIATMLLFYHMDTKFRNELDKKFIKRLDIKAKK